MDGKWSFVRIWVNWRLVQSSFISTVFWLKEPVSDFELRSNEEFLPWQPNETVHLCPSWHYVMMGLLRIIGLSLILLHNIIYYNL